MNSYKLFDFGLIPWNWYWNLSFEWENTRYQLSINSRVEAFSLFPIPICTYTIRKKE